MRALLFLANCFTAKAARDVIDRDVIHEYVKPQLSEQRAHWSEVTHIQYESSATCVMRMSVFKACGHRFPAAAAAASVVATAVVHRCAIKGTMFGRASGRLSVVGTWVVKVREGGVWGGRCCFVLLLYLCS